MLDSSPQTDSALQSSHAWSTTVATLLELHGRDRLDEESVRIVSTALARRGLKASPNLHAVLADRGTPHWSTDTDEPWNSPGLTAEIEPLRDVAVLVTPNVWLGLQGVIAVTMVVLGIVSYRTRPYSIATFIGGLVGAVVVVATSRIVIKSLPERTPRGRLFGAAVAALAIGLELAPLVVSRAL